MKNRSILGLVAASAVLFLAAAAPPAGKRRIEVQQAFVLGGQRLAAGSYELRWTSGRGSETVGLQVLQGRKVLLSARGRFVSWPSASHYDGTLDRYHASGEREILGLCFAGASEVIVIDEGATAWSASP